MGERIVLPIYVLGLFARYLLPIPNIILAWREWTATKKVCPATAWGRTMSQAGLFLFTAGLAFAVSVAVAEGAAILTHRAYYDSWLMYVGVLGSINAKALKRYY